MATQLFFIFTPKLEEDSHFWLIFFRWVGSTTNQKNKPALLKKKRFTHIAVLHIINHWHHQFKAIPQRGSGTLRQWWRESARLVGLLGVSVKTGRIETGLLGPKGPAGQIVLKLGDWNLWFFFWGGVDRLNPFWSWVICVFFQLSLGIAALVFLKTFFLKTKI